MPYYIYKISNAEMALLKQLELINQFDSFQDAKKFAKAQRAEQAPGDDSIIKVMFADNQLSAEEQLMEKREQPIVMEHEK